MRIEAPKDRNHPQLLPNITHGSGSPVWDDGNPPSSTAALSIAPKSFAGSTAMYPAHSESANTGGDPVTVLLACIGHVRARELHALRQEFNRPSRGGWGIVFDPFRACWIGVHGRHTTVYAGSAQELRERIISDIRRAFPLAA